MSPSLRSLPFSEFSRFGITNQTHPEGLADFGEMLVFICRILKTRQFYSYFTLNCQPQDSFSFFSTGNPFFARINLKPAALKNFAFDWKLCLRLCEVYRSQNLVGFELPIKHTLGSQSNTNSESSKSTVFRIGTNQIQ